LNYFSLRACLAFLQKTPHKQAQKEIKELQALPLKNSQGQLQDLLRQQPTGLRQW